MFIDVFWDEECKDDDDGGSLRRDSRSFRDTPIRQYPSFSDVEDHRSTPSRSKILSRLATSSGRRTLSRLLDDADVAIVLSPSFPPL